MSHKEGDLADILITMRMRSLLWATGPLALRPTSSFVRRGLRWKLFLLSPVHAHSHCGQLSMQ